jgi:Holliday junction resolvasome RuvABC DNA-binding subunit
MKNLNQNFLTSVKSINRKYVEKIILKKGTKCTQFRKSKKFFFWLRNPRVKI